jgi:hypothetical protein
MNLQEILNFVNLQVNKDQSGNALNKEEYNLCLKVANIEYFNWLYGLPQDYQPGRPIPRVAYEMNSYVTDSLKNFKIKMGGTDAPMFVDSNGKSPYPEDYVHESSIRFQNSKVEIVKDDHVGDRLEHSIMKPEMKYPIVVFYSDHLQFYPKNLGKVEFTYLRMPTTPIYASTIVNDGHVYDAANSTELEWPKSNHPDFLQFVLEYVAVNLREGMVYQNTLRRKAQGK